MGYTLIILLIYILAIKEFSIMSSIIAIVEIERVQSQTFILTPYNDILYFQNHIRGTGYK